MYLAIFLFTWEFSDDSGTVSTLSSKQAVVADKPTFSIDRYMLRKCAGPYETRKNKVPRSIASSVAAGESGGTVWTLPDLKWSDICLKNKCEYNIDKE
ncbi:hypothetical protein PG999_012950 [Apiospora kogelbergensis]|uniref:Uncharacterized protein n=1 Tax=Apiospora kogelbergensis TaxID=1337665 RepID=A0AAW0QJD2_9PEZI